MSFLRGVKMLALTVWISLILYCLAMTFFATPPERMQLGGLGSISFILGGFMALATPPVFLIYCIRRYIRNVPIEGGDTR